MFNSLTEIVNSLVGLIIAAPIIGKGCSRVCKSWKRPKVTWGESDFPSSRRVDYYVRVEAKTPLEGIRLVLRPTCMSPSDWAVKVTSFFQCIGYEHLNIKCIERNLEKHKEVEFDLPPSGLFRLTIESTGGYQGTLAVHNCEKIVIEHPEAKIKYKPRKFPKTL